MTTRIKNWILMPYLDLARWIEGEQTILVTDTFCVLTSVIAQFVVCYILRSTSSLMTFMFAPKCCLLLLLQPRYKMSYWHPFRGWLQMTANIIKGCFVFSAFGRIQHQSEWGDSTNHKRLWLQQCLRLCWRNHWVDDLCWRFQWGQRSMLGNGFIIKTNIYM